MRIQTPSPSQTGLAGQPRHARSGSTAKGIRLATAVAAGLALTSPALAQQSPQGLRYLSWQGKPDVAANSGMTQGGAYGAPQMQPVSTGRYPSIGSAGGRPSRYSPSVASGGLTPAGVWTAPGAMPNPSGLPIPAYAQGQAQAQAQAQGQGQAYAPQPYPAPAYAPQLQPQAQPQVGPGYARPQGFGQPVSVPQTALSAAPVYVQQAYTPQPVPGPHFQQQQQQLQQAQTSPGPAWTQPGYTPQVYGQQQAVAPSPQQPVYAPPAFMPQPRQDMPRQDMPRQDAPVAFQQQASATVTGPGWAGPQAATTGVPVADPMAPRRDAPIFSIQGAQQVQGQPQMQPQAQPQGQVQSQGQQTVSAGGPPRDGSRYYSVHRAAGHEPDPTPIPESVYAVIPEGAFLDAARTDLADPPAPPIQTRTINGRVQAITQGDNPSLP